MYTLIIKPYFEEDMHMSYGSYIEAWIMAQLILTFKVSGSFAIEKEA